MIKRLILRGFMLALAVQQPAEAACRVAPIHTAHKAAKKKYKAPVVAILGALTLLAGMGLGAAAYAAYSRRRRSGTGSLLPLSPAPTELSISGIKDFSDKLSSMCTSGRTYTFFQTSSFDTPAGIPPLSPRDPVCRRLSFSLPSAPIALRTPKVAFCGQDFGANQIFVQRFDGPRFPMNKLIDNCFVPEAFPRVLEHLPPYFELSDEARSAIVATLDSLPVHAVLFCAFSFDGGGTLFMAFDEHKNWCAFDSAGACIDPADFVSTMVLFRMYRLVFKGACVPSALSDGRASSAGD